MNTKLFLSIILIFISCNQSFARTPIYLPQKKPVLNLTNKIETSILDEDYKFEIESIRKSLKPFERKTIRQFYSSKNFWIGFTLSNSSQKDLEYILYFTSKLSGKVFLYEEKENSFQNTQITGSYLSYNKRNKKGIYPAFNIKIRAGETKEYFIKRKSIHPLQGQLILSSKKKFIEEERNQEVFLYFYIGAFTLLLFYSFFIFAYVKDSLHFLFSFFVLSVGVHTLIIIGGLDFLFPHVYPAPSEKCHLLHLGEWQWPYFLVKNFCFTLTKKIILLLF